MQTVADLCVYEPDYDILCIDGEWVLYFGEYPISAHECEHDAVYAAEHHADREVA